MQKYVQEVLVNCLFKLAQEKVWLDELTMTIAVDLGLKAAKQTNKAVVSNTKQCNHLGTGTVRYYIRLKEDPT